MSEQMVTGLIFFAMVLSPFVIGGVHEVCGKLKARRSAPEPKRERKMFEWEVRAIERECGIGLAEPGYQPSAAVLEAMNGDPEFVGERRLRDPFPLPIDRVWWIEDNEEVL